MANATIDVLYTGSLRLKISCIFFFIYFTFYKWCVTKVAHCRPLGDCITDDITTRDKDGLGRNQII